MSDRFDQLQSWVSTALHAHLVELTPISADASFRRYYRCIFGNRSYVVMDAPPPHEDCQPFIHIAGLMKSAGLHAPDVLAEDQARGFLLLSDLGKQTYLEALKENNADSLFQDAMASLLKWQKASRSGVLPAYDRALLRRELDLFTEWYVKAHLKITPTASEQNTLDSIFTLLEDSALNQPMVYVHRDYMPRNLMLSTPNPGILDFQDAVYGPITYDLVSLFKDAFLSWDQRRIERWRQSYWEMARQADLPVQPLSEFKRAFDWMGLQRHLKVLGIFARINYRDGKSGYLKDTPRFLNYVRDTGKLYREFTPLLELLDAFNNRAQDGLAAI